MARFSFSGYEVRDVGLATVDGLQSATADTSVFRSGLSSAKCNSGAGGVIQNCALVPRLVIANSTATYVYFVRGYFNFSQLPSSTVTIETFSGWDAGGSNYGVKMDSTGHLLALSGVASSSASSVALNTGQWYRIEFKVTFAITASTQRVSTINDVLLDGVSLGLTVNSTLSSAVPAAGSGIFCLFGWVEAPGTNRIVNVDDTAWNDDQGANQNSYPGSEKIVLSIPISDNARDTLWTGGVGGTSNLFSAVDNTPPIGTATETDLTQIEHAGGAAGTTDRYDANMTRYSDLGISQNDTINVMQFLDADGEDSGTGTKLLNFEVLSNPVMASPGNVTAGNDAGALGTYSTAWSVHRSAMTYNPSVIVGTSPVMRARRPETASRVASVCFMGIYVAYTPMGEKSLSVNQAVKRASVF